MKGEFEDINQEDRQWPKEKGQKDKQQFTKDYTKIKLKIEQHDPH